MNKKMIIMTIFSVSLLAILCCYLYNNKDNIEHVTYNLSELVEYSEEYGIYYTSDKVMEFLDQDVEIKCYVHVNAETNETILTNIPYVDSLSGLGKYKIVCVPAKGDLSKYNNKYTSCLSRIHDSEGGLYVEVKECTDLEDEKSTRQKEFEQFMTNNDFKSILEYMDNAEKAKDMQEYERKSIVHNLLETKERLKSNFYQSSDYIITVIDYLSYIYTNPNLYNAENMAKTKDALILNVIKWGLI